MKVPGRGVKREETSKREHQKRISTRDIREKERRGNTRAEGTMCPPHVTKPNDANFLLTNQAHSTP